MATVKTDEQNYINIANAIRAKTGSQETFTPGEMDEAILTIQTGGSGLTEEIKQALLNCFQNVAWINNQGATYYQALYDALYPENPGDVEYVKNGLIAWWDGLNNTGNGHDATATDWTDLVNNRKFSPFNSGVNQTWSFGTNHILFNPSTMGSAQAPGNVLKCPNFGLSQTIEVVFQTSVTDKSQIVAILTGDNSGSVEPRNMHLVSMIQGTKTVIVKGGDQNGCKAVDSLLNIHSVSATYGENVVEYINGAVAQTDGTVDYFTSVDYNSLLIGGSTSWAFKGKIYSIRMYNRVLSNAEIAANHAIDIARFGLE